MDTHSPKRKRGPRNPFEARSRVMDIIPDVRHILIESIGPLTAVKITEAIHGPNYAPWQWFDVTGALEHLRCPRQYSRAHGCNLYCLNPLALKTE